MTTFKKISGPLTRLHWHRDVLGYLTAFDMEPLSATASIIAVLQLSAKVLAYLNDVKDAPKDRTQCAIEMLNLCSLLYQLRDHVEKGDPTQPWYTAVQGLAVKNGPLDQFKQALETLQTKMTDGGRLKKAGEALVWKFKKEEVTSILDRMERLKSLVGIALQRDHLLLKWISPTDYPAQQSDIIKRRQEGTGQWLLDAPETARWLSETKGTLFCPGIPGAGKTMIAAIAIDHLLKSVQSSSVGVAYVYCNYKAQEEQDTSSLLAAILKQLVQARQSIVEPVERLHKQHADRGTRPLLDEVCSVLRDVLANYATVYIVVDALDECKDGTRRQFLAKLQDLRAGQDVRLMATSRFIPEIVDAFNEAPKLEVQASKEDVKRFVAGQLYRLPRCIQRDAALQEMVQEKIVEAVDGMFLLARLHTDSLLDKRTAKDVKSTLAKLSKGSAALHDAYNEAIQRIEGQLSRDSERAKKVLSWITYAQRPLNTTEICCALAVELEDEELDPENVPDIEDLVSLCAGLVVVDEGSAIIRLVHYTTQEYFERIGEEWNPSAQLDIALTCLTYLSFDTFRSGSCSSNKEFEERLRGSEFLDYAAKHWGRHILTVTIAINTKDSRGQTPLFLAAKHGHYGIVKLLVDKGADVNAHDGHYGNALQAASQGGHEQIKKLLLDRGADINAQGGHDGNALQAASYEGHKQIMKLLLDRGADINAQDGKMGNALQAALYKGRKQIVRLLFDRGADINAQGGYMGNVFQAALGEGHEQIVKLLLDQGAKVNAQDGGTNNAFQAALGEGHEPVQALFEGHEQIVKLLFDQGADVNA
ncbi:hypothetical protein DL767_009642 [Monosporascus sp. MG133]|nr:hypothetical protein DL767_009642 [Monosporascus sp. MG133]